MNKTGKTQPVSDKEIRDVVIARLRTMSSDKRISIGSEGDYSKDELIRKHHFTYSNTICQVSLAPTPSRPLIFPVPTVPHPLFQNT